MIRTIIFFALGAVASAQSTLPEARAQVVTLALDSPIQHYELEYASGKLTRIDDPQLVPVVEHQASVLAYDNSCNVSSFVGTGTSELIDWGTKSFGASMLVDSFTFGYATNAPDPSLGGSGATLEISFFAGTTGFGTLGTEVARYALTGLPGSLTGGYTGYFLTLDLSGTPGFYLPDGPIGYGYCTSDTLNTTGPILVDVSICTATGVIDAFDDWSYPASAPTATYNGTFNFMTPNVASFFLQLNEDDGLTLATTAVDYGAGGNPVLATDGGIAPIINGTWPLSVDPAAGGYTTSLGFFGIGSYAPGTLILGGGQEIIADISTYGPPIEALQSPPGSNLYPLHVVPDLGLVGLPVTFQGIVYGGTFPFALTNGVAGVVGC